MRSHIRHNFVLWTYKENGCGLDFSKAVIILDEKKYIDSDRKPIIRQNEFNSLKGKERIVYNKMLITNNEHISDMPLYNPKYMKVFRKAEDLDFSFIKGDTTVDYGYKNQFSPLLLKDQIKDAFLTR